MRKKMPVGEVAIINENLLKNKIYTIRGVKVMLDADLAELVNYLMLLQSKAFTCS